MSAPKVAKSYLPAINVAVEHASASLTPEEGEQFDVFIARLAFDMFCMVALGKHMRTVTPDMAAPSDMKFVQNTMNGFSAAGILTREPHKRHCRASPPAPQRQIVRKDEQQPPE